MSNRKGQSAIEYLTTYSWMLLAVSVAAGTTFSAVDRSCERSSFGFYSDNIDFQSFAINDNDTLLMSLRNDAFEDIEIKNISVQRDEGVFRSRTASTVIPVGEDGTIGVPGYSSFDGCSTFNVEIKYDRGPLSSQTISGELRAPYEVTQLPIPDPPSNLNVDVS
ncbi:MAG: hypothetical protein J07AB43_03900 [Candidatus Nanosalina sp. J07AB43]|jgi:hypothetical protein|nr:MAG: hypothetical protein J07AB43_03900 [Candidatus Nanosalina sp. J07AB43]